MTVRTRKTITDLIQQLKVQEKEIKSQLSDGQRRLNETRDRIATCYWVIEESGDVEPCEDYDPCEELTRLSQKEFQELVDANPHLTYEQVEDIITQNGMILPVPSPKSEKWREISKEEWEELILMHPRLSPVEIENILHSQNLFAPDPYDGCPCSDCNKTYKSKPKAKPKKKVSKKPTKKTKKGKK